MIDRENSTFLIRILLVTMLSAWGMAATAYASTCPPHYEGKLVLSPQADGRTMQLMQAYAFVDPQCERWVVPKGAVVDGASIPQALWSLVGGPFEGRYREASVIHDWFCSLRSRPWRSVHRMFYDAMLASGYDTRKAKLLYLAVYYDGPRWDAMTEANSRMAARHRLSSGMYCFPEPNGMCGNPPPSPPVLDFRLIRMMSSFIDIKDPSLDDLDKFADNLDDIGKK